MIERVHIEAAVRDVQEAVQSPFFSGTFATAIAALIQVAEEAKEQDESVAQGAQNALEMAESCLQEMEGGLDRAFNTLSDLEDAINSLQSDYEDAKGEIEEALSSIRGY